MKHALSLVASSAVAAMFWACSSRAVAVVPLDEAGTGDDAGETPAEDAGTDAVADARPDAPVVTGYCATLSPAPKFCDSFDDGVLANGWDQVTMGAFGQASLEPGEFRSAPTSLAFDVVGVPAMAIGNTNLRTTIEGTGTRVRFSMSTYLSQASFASGAVAIATIDVTPNHWFTLWLRDLDGTTPAASLEEITGASSTRQLLTSLPPIQTWTRVSVDLDLTAGTATVRFDNTVALNATPITTGTANNPTIRIGAVYVYGPTPALGVLVDDVVLDF